MAGTKLAGGGFTCVVAQAVVTVLSNSKAAVKQAITLKLRLAALSLSDKLTGLEGILSYLLFDYEIFIGSQ